jgi:signal transduction histidine kinase
MKFPHGAGYAVLALAVALAAALISFTALAAQFDNNLYDWMFRVHPAGRRSLEAVILAFDDRTLIEHGGVRGLRRTLAEVLELLAAAPPRVTAVDLTLADAGDPAEDARLAEAMTRFPALVLAAEMLPDGSGWQNPRPEFLAASEAAGHVHALPGPLDEINRAIALERAAGRERRWALALETYRLNMGGGEILSTPADLEVSGLRIPSRQDAGRPLRVHYRPSDTVESLPVRTLLADPGNAAALRGRVVFIGVTALSAIPDRLFTPLTPLQGNRPMAGVEIHAQAFETIANRSFLVDVPAIVPLALAFTVAAAMAAAFAFTPAPAAYAISTLLLLVAHGLPWLAFVGRLVMPPFATVATAWGAFGVCAAFQFFYVRRQLATSERKTARYQQAFQFVAHEMRTPLTAIQGSSEIISRYNLPEEKRKQMGQMINAESKRLAQMITTFLDVERLTAGEMDLRRGAVPVNDLIRSCVDRARPLAERKRMAIETDVSPDLTANADRELLEYAIYNLLTNAIKYSPEQTSVRLEAAVAGAALRISVTDRGMGMTPDEVKNLGRKFYRTERAERAGIQGTGIGLSIVHEIITLHGGRVTVKSAPDEGSTFTLHLPAAS